MTNTNPASNFSTIFLAQLCAYGVQDIVVCPGSRAQALTLAAAELEEMGKIRLHVRVDERSAAFLALGIALETGVPAPIVVTSGTAAINLLPGITEGHHASVPMIVLTGDRPEHLHNVGSGQTTLQTGIMPHLFRYQTSIEIDRLRLEEAVTLAAECWGRSTDSRYPGPVHVNIGFDDPLSGETGIEDVERLIADTAEQLENAASLILDAPSPLWKETFQTEPDEVSVSADAKTLVIAGSGAGDTAAKVAEALNAPLVAEISSGSRFGPNLVTHYRDVLADEACMAEIERIILFGIPTLSRQVPEAIAHVSEVIVATSHLPELFNPSGRTITIAKKITVEEASDQAYREAEELLEQWRVRDREIGAAIAESAPAPNLELANDAHYLAQAKFIQQELDIDRRQLTRATLVDNLWQASWPHDRLMVAPSMMVRVLDHRAHGRNIRVFSNRGVAGIDGNIATALGIANAKPKTEPGITRLLIGDLAFIHDIGSLFHNPLEAVPDLQIIVANDGGGGIFDSLEVAHTKNQAGYDRAVYVPHAQEFEQIVTGFGHRYVRITGEGELMRTLTAPTPGITVIEVPLERIGESEQT